MRRILGLVLLPLVLLAAVAACGSEGSSDDDGGAGTPTGDDLEGRTFVTEGLTVSFADGRLSAQPGCNTLGGPYRIEDGRLTVGELAMTEMACDDPALMEADAAFAAFLQAGPTITLEGPTLTLATADTTWVLTDREVADPDRPLFGRWIPETLIDGPTASSIPAGVRAELHLPPAPEPSAMWVVGCQGASVSTGMTVDEDAGTITLEPALPMAVENCSTATPDEDRQVFEAMSAVLTGTVTYTIDTDVLTLTNGDRGLQLRASE